MRNLFRLFFVSLLVCVALFGCTSDTDPVNTDIYSETESDAIVTDEETESESSTQTEKETEKETETEPEKVELDLKKKMNYSLENGVVLRDIVIDSGKGGDPIEIIQLTDVHINYCNEEDLTDPVLKDEYKDRWLNHFGVKAKLERCLSYAREADQLVITGDLFDYLSLGILEKAKEYVFDPFPNVLVAPGNHDPMEKTQQNRTLAERLEVLKEAWPHDIYYESRVLGEKVMLIVMDNATMVSEVDGVKIGSFHESQVPLLEADLTLAREKGYSVLLFYHVPISTGNPEDRNVKALLVGDSKITVINFFDKDKCIGRMSSGASKKVYDLIVNNADLIKGTFCGHHHSDFYTEIYGRGIDGSIVTIPQYVVTGVPYYNGNVMRITVK